MPGLESRRLLSRKRTTKRSVRWLRPCGVPELRRPKKISVRWLRLRGVPERRRIEREDRAKQVVINLLYAYLLKHKFAILTVGNRKTPSLRRSISA